MKVRTDQVDFAKCQEIADSCTNSNLRKASRIVGSIYDDALRPVDLRGTQLSVLVALALLETATVKRLAKTVAVDRTSLTRKLSPLERDGLISSVSGEDGRERVLRLTQKGYDKLSEGIRLWEHAQATVKDALGDANWRSLIGRLKSTAKVLAD